MMVGVEAESYSSTSLSPAQKQAYPYEIRSPKDMKQRIIIESVVARETAPSPNDDRWSTIRRVVMLTKRWQDHMFLTTKITLPCFPSQTTSSSRIIWMKIVPYESDAKQEIWLRSQSGRHSQYRRIFPSRSHIQKKEQGIRIQYISWKYLPAHYFGTMAIRSFSQICFLS